MSSFTECVRSAAVDRGVFDAAMLNARERWPDAPLTAAWHGMWIAATSASAEKETGRG